MDLTDEALIQQYRQTGDVNQFKTLVRRYQTRVYSAAVRIIGNTEEAEEVVQDTFLKVHQNIDQFRKEASFSAWLFRIAHNECVTLIRNKKRKRGFRLLSFDPQSIHQDHEDASENQQVVSQIADQTLRPDEQLDFNEQEHMISASLSQLPENQREVLVLHDIEGFSYQEISDIVGASIGTVRSRLHYGRIKLRELLEPYFSSRAMTPAPR